MDYLSATLTVLYYFAYPIFFILQVILSILAIITAPLLHLGHYFLYACYYPIHILGKFEVLLLAPRINSRIIDIAPQTLYIFLGVAVLVGALTGTSLHYASGLIVSLLRLKSQPEEQRGRTLASYRQEKRDKRQNNPSLKLSYYGLGGPVGRDATLGRNFMDFDQSPTHPPEKYAQKSGGGRKNDAAMKEEPMDFEWAKQGRGRAKNDLINTILEEDSTEDGF